VRFDEAERWLTVTRGPLIVACNLGGAAQRVPMAIGHNAQILFASEQDIRLVEDQVKLPPDSVALIGR
jgi:maltooligosyltrehalose trehalohydrolase